MRSKLQEVNCHLKSSSTHLKALEEENQKLRESNANLSQSKVVGMAHAFIVQELASNADYRRYTYVTTIPR